MLAIRMQRTGRKGHAMFRMVVQEARLTPTSGKVVAYLGSYDPHAKQLILDKDKAEYYLEHGARPTPRIVRIFQTEKVKLPKWVSEAKPKTRPVRHPEKRRSTAPKEEIKESVQESKQEPEAELVDEKSSDNTSSAGDQPVVDAVSSDQAEEQAESSSADQAKSEPEDAPANPEK